MVTINFTRTSKNKSGSFNVHYSIMDTEKDTIKRKRVFKNLNDDTLDILNCISNCLAKENYDKYFIDYMKYAHEECFEFIYKILLDDKRVPNFYIDEKMFEITSIEKPSTKKYEIHCDSLYKKLELTLDEMSEKQFVEELFKFETLIYESESRLIDIISKFITKTIKENNEKVFISESILGKIRAATKIRFIYLNPRNIHVINTLHTFSLNQKKKVFTEMVFESPINLYNIIIDIIQFCLKDTVYVNPDICI